MFKTQLVTIKSNVHHNKNLLKKALIHNGESGRIEKVGATYVGVRLTKSGKRKTFHREDAVPAIQ